MSKQVLAEMLVNEWKLAHGWTPANILQEHFATQERSRMASERREAGEARVMVAGVTMDFVKDVAKALGSSLGSIVELLKDTKIVRFFSKIGWSFKRLYDLMKQGYQAYRDLRKVMGDYLANTRVGKWTKEELKKLDDYFKGHPIAKRITGIVLGGLLLFMWFKMADIGDPEWDFDMSEVFDALSGRYSFTDIFSGPSGSMLLLSLLVGTVVSFPWPGPGSVIFVYSIVNTLIKKLRIRFRAERIKNIREELEKTPIMGV